MVRTARYKKKLSQKALGKKLGISQSTLSRIENLRSKERYMSIGMLKDISVILDINIYELLDYFLDASDNKK